MLFKCLGCKKEYTMFQEASSCCSKTFTAHAKGNSSTEVSGAYWRAAFVQYVVEDCGKDSIDKCEDW